LSGAPRILPVGKAAFSVELGREIDAGTNARVHALDAALAEHPFDGFLEALPSYRALLVLFEPSAGASAVRAAIRERLDRPREAALPPRLHRLRVCYDGPDLERVARHTGLSRPQVVELHAAGEYRTMMLGFRPGFGYLGLTDPRLEVPRLATPRPRIEAGAVALAGRQTAVYPGVSPGGWNLIGRSDARLFDPEAGEPALLRPGDRVVFEPVDALPESERPARRAQTPAEPAIEVEQAGLLSSVQDLGRPGFLRLGVSRGGVADRPAAIAANTALGNPRGAALVETSGPGLVLRFLKTTRFCLTGGDLGAILERDDLGRWPVPLGRPVLARPGNRLRLSELRGGFRCYLALLGGLDVAPVLGSRSTDLGGAFGGLGGRALATGDRLGTLEPPRSPESEVRASPPGLDVALRVVPGPQADHFEPAALETLYGSEYALEPDADRTGCRLRGPRLEARPAEIVSDGLLPGAIQVPPDGQPIVMLADAPTSGGYPKPGVVVEEDLAKLAQLAPGSGRVRFVPLELN
jgi:KipI family sensor histidine kinase inhibitor